MSTINAIPAKAGAPRIDGIDIGQLLRDIGEASANTSAVDLFGLLLGAQRVLAQVQASGASMATKDEAALLVAYRAADDNGRVDNIDVGQLLRNIGEASANSSAVDLFGLLLGAQRVLAQVQASGASMATKDEAALLGAYRAADDDGRVNIILAAGAVARVSPRQRPVLTLVRARRKTRKD